VLRRNHRVTTNSNVRYLSSAINLPAICRCNSGLSHLLRFCSWTFVLEECNPFIDLVQIFERWSLVVTRADFWRRRRKCTAEPFHRRAQSCLTTQHLLKTSLDFLLSRIRGPRWLDGRRYEAGLRHRRFKGKVASSWWHVPHLIGHPWRRRLKRNRAWCRLEVGWLRRTTENHDETREMSFHQGRLGEG
jgi:hypothetical protein